MTNNFSKTVFACAVTTVGFLVCPLMVHATGGTPDDVNSQKIIQSLKGDFVSWNNVQADDFEALIGDSFNLLSADGTSLTLTLAEIELMGVDLNRPDFLVRDRGFFAMFSGAETDAQWLMSTGGQTMQVFHETLGNGLVYVSALPRETGGYTFHVVFN